jgi:uncharacterized protein YndB with AHSA1/START domain
MLKKIAIGFFVVLLLGIGGVLVLAAAKPDSFRVQRTATINAPPDKIFPLINDFGGWRAWSPYEKRDPDMKRTFGAVAAGKGAVYAWEGNGNVGKGRMEITEATPPSRIAIKLDFMEPFEGHNVAEFTLAPKSGSTDVTWAMYGPAPFISKVMQVFFNFDTMIGKDFEEGLANLKTLAEK